MRFFLQEKESYIYESLILISTNGQYIKNVLTLTLRQRLYWGQKGGGAMEYSIQQMAKLSGVTTRTLRWYDKIHLLKPSRVAENGYRYYGSAEVDRLQDILFYREMGVKLAQIGAYLDDPSFHRLTALRGHLQRLEAEQKRLEGLIQTVKETIYAEERSEIMADEKKFAAFKQKAVYWNEQTYGKELREKYGDAEVDAAQKAVLNLTSEQYDQWMTLAAQIQKELEEAVAEGKDPKGEAGREITELHRRWLQCSGQQYMSQKHQALAEMYVADSRFTAYYDKKVSGCAAFLRDAVLHWVKP